jgi:hypothetical protein
MGQPVKPRRQQCAADKHHHNVDNQRPQRPHVFDDKSADASCQALIYRSPEVRRYAVPEPVTSSDVPVDCPEKRGKTPENPRWNILAKFPLTVFAGKRLRQE